MTNSATAPNPIAPNTTATSATVIVVGSVTADLTSFSDRLPQRGETVLGNAFTLALGGKGANQAVAAARAGAHAHLVGSVGDDLFSTLVLGSLASHGVGTEDVVKRDGPTGVAHIRVDSTGENDIVIVPLANALLTNDQVDGALQRHRENASVLLTQLEIPLDVAGHAIRAGKAAGMTVLLDPAPALEIDEALWPFVDLVTPNETEAGILTGISVVDRESAVAAGRWFCDRGAANAVITLASAGAVLVTATDVTHFDAYPVTAIDTTAAGDAFAGYLGAAIATGLALADAIPIAMAAGAITVTRRGASPSLPARAEVEDFLNHHQMTPILAEKAAL